MKNKKLLLAFSVLLLSNLCSCNNSVNSDNNNNSNVIDDTSSSIVSTDVVNNAEKDSDIPYKQVVSEGGKATILNRQLVPQLLLSTLLRTDLLINADFMSTEDMEDYFAICKETGMNTIELTIMWSQIEKSEGVYDFTDIENYLNFAKKYDLKINIEWYGSFVDGEYHSANVPSYINNNPAKYSVLEDLFDYANYGRCKIMDWTDKDLLDAERKAIYNMMNYIYTWNHQNDLYDPVVMVQIGQGVDRFQRWRVDSYKIKGRNGEQKMPDDQAYAMVHTYLNEVAKGVKYSKYKALTRSEFCEQNAVVNYVRNVMSLEYIDIVCPTYLHEMSNTKSGIKSFVDEYPEMAVMNVENWANDNNYKQILATIAMGAIGYASYQLSCPNYFPESPNGALYARYNAGGKTLSEKFVERNNRASDTKLINTALNKAFVAVCNAKRTNFATFGLNNKLNNQTGAARYQKVYLNNGILVNYSNPQDAVGFAVVDGNYLYAFSSKNASLEITNCNVVVATKGEFKTDGTWKNDGSVSLEQNTKLTMEANVIYRIRINDIKSLPDKETLNKEGYASTLDGIKG